MGTGTAWHKKNSPLACKALVRSSEDPLHGNDRKAGAFFAKVHQTYVQLCQNDIDGPVLQVGYGTYSVRSSGA